MKLTKTVCCMLFIAATYTPIFAQDDAKDKKPSPEEQANRLGRWNRRKEKKVSAAIKLQSFRERSTTLRRYRTNHGFRMPWGSSEARSEKRKSYNRSGNT